VEEEQRWGKWGAEKSSREFPGLYTDIWSRSMVGGLGRDWAPWAASEDGIVVQVQGSGRWRRWLAGVVTVEVVSEG
jgi:hypothetical protein